MTTIEVYLPSGNIALVVADTATVTLEESLGYIADSEVRTHARLSEAEAIEEVESIDYVSTGRRPARRPVRPGSALWRFIVQRAKEQLLAY